MARDISEILREYDVITQSIEDPFTLGDLTQIYNTLEEQGKSPSCDTIATALKYAFVVCYKEFKEPVKER